MHRENAVLRKNGVVFLESRRDVIIIIPFENKTMIIYTYLKKTRLFAITTVINATPTSTPTSCCFSQGNSFSGPLYEGF